MSLRTVYERTFDEDVPATERSSSGCPECGGIVHTNSIETVCDDCGLVLEDRPIDHGPEWCAFDDTERIERTRTGPALPPTRPDRGLSSEIGFDRTDANGTTLSSRKRSQIGRLRREHRRRRWSSKAEQNPAHGFSEVRRIVGALDLPRSLRDQGCRLYRTAAGEDLIRGRSIEAMAAASVYAACRCAGLSRTSASRSRRRAPRPGSPSLPLCRRLRCPSPTPSRRRRRPRSCRSVRRSRPSPLRSAGRQGCQIGRRRASGRDSAFRLATVNGPPPTSLSRCNVDRSVRSWRLNLLVPIHCCIDP
jgi:hypothetical protein